MGLLLEPTGTESRPVWEMDDWTGTTVPLFPSSRGRSNFLWTPSVVWKNRVVEVDS